MGVATMHHCPMAVETAPIMHGEVPLPVVAHRGNAGEFPENTLPAIKSAIALGAPFVEFDVQLSADRVPFVIHDADLKRTAGLPYSVLDSPAAELAVRSVHEPARFGERFAGTNIPALRDVVELVQQARGVTAFVEVKRASIARHGLHAVMDQVLKGIEPMGEHSVLISFSSDAVRHAQERGRRAGGVLESYDDESRKKLDALKPEFVFCNVGKLPPDESALWSGPWQWVLYEVDTIGLAQQLKARGPHLIETMQVAAMIDFLRRPAGS